MAILPFRYRVILVAFVKSVYFLLCLKTRGHAEVLLYNCLNYKLTNSRAQIQVLIYVRQAQYTGTILYVQAYRRCSNWFLVSCIDLRQIEAFYP